MAGSVKPIKKIKNMPGLNTWGNLLVTILGSIRLTPWYYFLVDKPSFPAMRDILLAGFELLEFSSVAFILRCILIMGWAFSFSSGHSSW